MRLHRGRAAAVAGLGRGPGLACALDVGRVVLERLFGRGNALGVGAGVSLELVHPGRQLGALGRQEGFTAGRQSLEVGVGRRRAFAEDRPYGLLLGAKLRGLVVKHLFALGHLLQLVAVGHLRHRVAGLLHRQPHHRNHVSDDQDDVLRHLGPGHRLHPAEERTDENAGQADEDADAELKPGEARGDDADAVDLRHHIGEGTEDGRQYADHARQMAAVAGAEEIGDGELAELAQVRREEQRHQAVAAGPAHDEGQAVVTREVERPRHADEGGRAHPVGAGRHAVEQGRDAPAGNVVLADVGGLGHEADAGVEQHRRAEEHVAEHLVLHAHVLEQADQDDEGDEASGVEGVIPRQLFEEGGIRGLCAHQSSPSCTPYSWSSAFM